jgi:two-component system, sensor histidine kinase and response regulator
MGAILVARRRWKRFGKQRPMGTPYDFVIADYQMPGLDGASLASVVAKDSLLAKPIFVILTSVGHLMEAKELHSSIDACLAKPVRASQLLNALVTAWSKKSATALTQADPAVTRAPSPANVVAGMFARLGFRVLVVEDNIVNQRVAVRMLERLGLAVDVAGNGSVALQILERQRYDVIFMDCQMPIMDGYETATEIRRREAQDAHTTIIAMTADVLKGSRERCLAAGMDLFISKPVKLDDLVKALQSKLSSTEISAG